MEMRISRRSVMLNAAMGGALAACGTAGGDGSTSSAAKRPATISYLARYAGAIGEVEEKSIPVFKAKFPHITVERTYIGSGSYDALLEKVTTGFASGTAP